MASLDFRKGAVFWLDAENQTENTSDKSHYWVVLVVSGEKVLWVPLSSHKSWIKPESTYVVLPHPSDGEAGECLERLAVNVGRQARE
jgi:hypothetical protein